MRSWKITQDYFPTFPNLRKQFKMTNDLIQELEEYMSSVW